jgi:hypothetical protein
MQADPSAPPLDEVVVDFHVDCGPDAGKSKRHQANESAIAEAYDARHLFFLA